MFRTGTPSLEIVVPRPAVQLSNIGIYEIVESIILKFVRDTKYNLLVQ